MDWFSWLASDLPTWLTAIGTVGTLAVAVWVLKREQDDRRQRDQDDRRRQARRVSITEPFGQGGGSSTSTTTGLMIMAMKYGITVRNDSDETVNSLVVRWIGKPKDPAADPWAYDVATEQGRLLPGAEKTVTRTMPIPYVEGSGNYLSITTASELLFTDAAGSRWHRDREHTLHEVIGADPFQPYTPIAKAT